MGGLFCCFTSEIGLLKNIPFPLMGPERRENITVKGGKGDGSKG